MAVASVAYLLIYNVAPDLIAAQRMIAGVESFPLLAVPFFILAGNLMNIAGVTGRIYSFALALVGWMKGGLAQVNIIGSVIFSGMSGTALADAAGIGTIEIKAMKDHGYPVEAAVGVTAASCDARADLPAIAALRHLRHDGQCLDRRAIHGRHRARRRDDAIDDDHRRDLRLQARLGFRHAVLARQAWRGHRWKFSSSRCFPLGVYLLVSTGSLDQHRGIGRTCCARCGRLVFRLLRRDGADDAGHPDRRHDDGLVYADRSRNGGGACGRCS